MARLALGVRRLAPASLPGLRDGLASLISHVGAPPLLALAAAALLAAHTPERGAWGWAFAFGSAAVLLPTLYIVVQVQRGLISDIHIPIREQRTRPFLVTLAAALAVWGACLWWQAPAAFRALALAYLLQTALLFAITLQWKVSMHAAAAGSLGVLSLTVLGVSLLSVAGALCVASVPLIAWARIRLKRHTPAQTLVGALVGAGVTLAALWAAL